MPTSRCLRDTAACLSPTHRAPSAHQAGGCDERRVPGADPARQDWPGTSGPALGLRLGGGCFPGMAPPGPTVTEAERGGGSGEGAAPHLVRGAAAAAGSEEAAWPARRATGGGWAAAGGRRARAARPSSSGGSGRRRRPGPCAAIPAPRHVRGGPGGGPAPRCGGREAAAAGSPTRLPQKRPAVRGRRLAPVSRFSSSRISTSFWYICGRRARERGRRQRAPPAGLAASGTNAGHSSAEPPARFPVAGGGLGVGGR